MQGTDVDVRASDLLAEYPTIDINAMGFPKNWEIEPLWR